MAPEKCFEMSDVGILRLRCGANAENKRQIKKRKRKKIVVFGSPNLVFGTGNHS